MDCITHFIKSIMGFFLHAKAVRFLSLNTLFVLRPEAQYSVSSLCALLCQDLSAAFICFPTHGRLLIE